jgi:voltage-gated potassium channel
MSIWSTISKDIRRRLFYTSLAIALTIFLGAVGFHFIEGDSWLDSFYLATQTVTTVGYGDIPPKTFYGKIFATTFILVGVGTALYALTLLAQAILQSEVFEVLKKQRKTKEMSKLQNHYIVCGAGRVGRRIIRQLERQNVQFVLIERDESKMGEFIEQDSFVILGDATSEENLLKAGVEKASGLVTCLADDASNVYVVLTARGMNEKLHIVARAIEEEAEPKLIRAGASRVVSPIIIGSQSMARALLKPAVADFMDSIVAETLDLAFEEVTIEKTSSFVDKKLKDTNIRAELDLVVVAIRRKNGEMLFHPSGESEVFEGDLLLTIGRGESMKKLVELSK